MKRQNVASAEFLKSQVIDFLISKYSDDVLIGNEVMYGTKRKLVDLLVLHSNKLTALEIKADNDDLRKIQEQITEYKKIFDYVIVCTTTNHLKKLEQLLLEDIGIYCITDGNVEIMRLPQKQKHIDKVEMLFTINSKFLRQHFQTQKINMNSDEIRAKYKQESTKKIHTIFIDYLYNKIESKFNLFLQHRGNVTHIDDIPLLSIPSPVICFP
jgi:hypothetical protein